MNEHILSRDEIENWRAHLLDNEQRDEERLQIEILCDMALECLENRLDE